MEINILCLCPKSHIDNIDIDAFNHDESVDQIDFESAVDLIEPCLHNSGLAKWRNLRGVDVDYIQW